MPERVVAPIKVKWGMSSLMERAAGPLPITMSSAKSSIAGYRISSTWRFRRWISSMNSTSPACRLVRMAARSPVRAMAGPEVVLICAPISLATTAASVVFPRPGGPEKITWSRHSPRDWAAWMRMRRLCLIWSWPQ